MKQSTKQLDKSLAILSGIAFILFIVAYWPAWKILISIWATSDEYSHAFLTLPIIIHIIWIKRSSLKSENSRLQTLLGVVLLLFAVGLYCFALLTQVNTVIFLSMFLTIIAIIIYLFGFTVVSKLYVPLLLFLILFPIPDQLYIKITYPLQLKVSQASEFLVRLLNISILREGNVMSIPAKSFEVVEACSGLRSMITLLTLSVIMSYYLLQKNISKIVLILTSVPTAILVNIIRVTSMITLYHFFKLDLTEGLLHNALGVIVFILALAILLLLQKVLERWEIK